MSVFCHISVSLDGFVAGPNQSHAAGLGEGGERLHEWMFPPGGRARADADEQVLEAVTRDVGAYIMGRNMFTAGRGDWDLDWRGWWGEDPPFHAPVFVLTHHAREPIEMQGGTTYHFVTDGIESALEHARAAAGEGRRVSIAGGANTVQQYLRAGLLDELQLDIVPVLLGDGERLFEDVGDPRLTPVEVVASPAVTHVTYRVG
jgi:dihydrofolate reductase